MGPNALPVPEIFDGRLPGNSTFEFSWENHFSSGDNTGNIYTELFLPLFSERAGVRLSMVPFEYYQMDTLTRDLRRARDFDARGVSVGDVYVGTYVQLVRDHQSLPDVLLSATIKTASGGNLQAARFTNSPGYFFDISTGKKLTLGGFVEAVRPYGVAGYYVWQTYRDDYFQNDAFIYGLGCVLTFGNYSLDNYLGGYSGYIGEGDKPLVYRLTLQTKCNSHINFILRFQQGIRDFGYTSFRVGARYQWPLDERVPD